MEKNYLNPHGLSTVFGIVKGWITQAVSTKAPLHAVSNGITTGGTGAAYTATVDGITALTAGATFVMVPHVVSTIVNPTLDVNGLGAKMIRRRVSNSSVTTVVASSANWLGAGKPVRVLYDGNFWIADITRPNATDIYGTVAIESGGTGATTAAGSRENLGAQAQHLTVPVRLSATSWADNKTQTVQVDGVTADNTVLAGPAPASDTLYRECAVLCTAQANGSMTFSCEDVPASDLTVNVIILD